MGNLVGGTGNGQQATNHLLAGMDCFQASLSTLVYGATFAKAGKEALSKGREQVTAGVKDLASCKDRKEALMKVVEGLESCARACVTIAYCPVFCISLATSRVGDVATRKRLVKAMAWTAGAWYAPAKDAADLLLSVTDRCLEAAATVKSLSVDDKDLESKVNAEVERVAAEQTRGNFIQP